MTRRSIRPRVTGVATGVAALLLLASCGGERWSPDTAVVSVGRPAPVATVDQASIHPELRGSKVVDPGWDSEPQERDGTFLAMRYPSEAEPALTFVAVDSTGEILWTTQRNPACTGHSISRTPAGPVAVLTDSDADPDSGRLATRTTASGYDLHTGAHLWGPVEVPGPHQGPGAVFAAPAPAAAMGATGPRRVLDPATGRTVTDEADARHLEVIGEYDGVVILAEGHELRGVVDGSTLWEVDTAGAEVITGTGGELHLSMGSGQAVIDPLAGPGELAERVDDPPAPTPHEGGLVRPDLVSATGAAVITVERPLLVTTDPST